MHQARVSPPYLKGHVGELGAGHEVFELFTHDLGAADELSQCRLVDDGSQRERVCLVQPCLPLCAKIGTLLHDDLISLRYPRLDEFGGVTLGLQQPWNQLSRELAHFGGLGLQSDVLLEVRRQRVLSVPLPPALLPGLQGKRDILVSFRVGNAIDCCQRENLGRAGAAHSRAARGAGAGAYNVWDLIAQVEAERKDEQDRAIVRPSWPSGPQFPD